MAKRTLKNIIVGAIFVPLFTGFGAFTGEQLRKRYNPNVDLIYQTRKENIGFNRYTVAGGAAGLAVAAFAISREIKSDRRERYRPR